MKTFPGLTALSLLSTAAVSSAHSRFFCPAARDPSTGLKTGPCGVEDDDGSTYYADTDSIVVQPGPMTIVWQESIAHAGAPWRFSLSADGNDLESCVLLDHVPHNPDSSPSYSDESTWTLYNITVVIPDVDCEKCSLHLSNPMTDKIGDAKYYDGEGCCDPGADDCSSTTSPAQCSSVYHSCTVPLRINGTTPRSEYVCPGLPSDWPATFTGTSNPDTDPPPAVDVTTPGVYRQESSTWSDGQLQTVPGRYRAEAGICVVSVCWTELFCLQSLMTLISCGNFVDQGTTTGDVDDTGVTSHSTACVASLFSCVLVRCLPMVMNLRKTIIVVCISTVVYQ